MTKQKKIGKKRYKKLKKLNISYKNITGVFYICQKKNGDIIKKEYRRTLKKIKHLI